MPSVVALVVEPVLGLVAATGRQRVLVLAGGACFAGALALAALAPSPLVLLVAFAVLYPAAGAFVSLSQATLMDLEPARREDNMARWTLAGAAGAVGGPLALAALTGAGAGWRGLFLGLALLAVGLLPLVARLPRPAAAAEGLRVREALRALRRGAVLRWLVLLEVSDLMLDVLCGFLALYLVDVAGASLATAALAVGLWTGADLVGAAAMIPLLRRVDGSLYLRWSALATAALFAGFLLAPGSGGKMALALAAAISLVNAGWYPVLQARLYGALDGASGLVLTVGALFPLNSVLPLGIALAAERLGLGLALWPLLLAPLALLLGVPGRGAQPRS